MKKTLIMMVAVFMVIAVACNDKKKPVEPKPVQQEVVKPAPVEKDTIAEQIQEPEPEPVEPDRYFLIAGSFTHQGNAETFQKQLANQGFNSQVITRDWGENREFYKVSYMGFKDRKEAISKMKQERQQAGKEDVWVLVKK